MLSRKNLQKYSEVEKPHSDAISLMDLLLDSRMYLDVCSRILPKKVAGGTPVSFKNSLRNQELLTHK